MEGGMCIKLALFTRSYRDARPTEHKTYHLHVPIVLNSGSFNLLDPSGPIQALNGIAFTVDRLSGNGFVTILDII
jgi:hypothetical protein